LAPRFLAQALDGLPEYSHPDLLVGFNQADDAGIFRINEQQALVQTVDFFPPIVDDPYQFGLIAAANALSDVYAMGGRPLTALNIVAFPVGDVPDSYLTEILRGGGDKIAEAEAVVVGGHSIKDKELKYGVAVTGIVDPQRIITNGGAKPGDRLFLTKPLGTGLITTGIKRNAVEPELERIVATQMAQLNRGAAELMVRHNAHAATDITGYGLLGHALEMAQASDVSIRFSARLVPLMPQALELAEAKMIPGGANANREFLQGHLTVSGDVPENVQVVLFDPQTSGGLLIAIAEDDADQFSADLEKAGLFGWQIGRVEPPQDHRIVVE
jgi:selenide,water dikinase